jgi:hypothetical protein
MMHTNPLRGSRWNVGAPQSGVAASPEIVGAAEAEGTGRGAATRSAGSVVRWGTVGNGVNIVADAVTAGDGGDVLSSGAIVVAGRAEAIGSASAGAAIALGADGGAPAARLWSA